MTLTKPLLKGILGKESGLNRNAFLFFSYLTLEVILLNCVAVLARLETFNGSDKWFVNRPYIQVIEQHGWACFPITSYASLHFALQHCHCLLLPGGYDVQSYYLGEERRKECTYYDSFLDHFEFDCLDAFIKKQMPVLGICRGMQLINLYFKGTLLSHIDETSHAIDHQHVLHISSHSFLSQVMEDESIVNSYHHQVVGKLGEGLIAGAHSEEMYIEALQHKQLPIIAVQWHPELLSHTQLFSYFFDILCA